MRRLALLLLLCCLAWTGCGSDEDQPAADDGGAAAQTTPGCEDVEAPAARADGGAERPDGALDPSKTWTATVKTSCGDFAITLDAKGSPKTASSFAGLAEQGFYDDTVFHRIAPGFVIQGGDPTQTGSGGPGYAVQEAPADDTRYVRGVVAMAKTGAEPAGTSGSQFFVVTGPEATLPPDYAVAGTVSSGLDVVDRIGQLGDAAEQPTQAVVVDSVTVASS